MTQHPAPASPGAPDLDAFGRELHRRMQGTGYEVVREGDSVVVRANLADRSWWVFAQRNHLTEVWETRLTPRRPGVLDMDDRRRSLEWSAGIPTLGSLSSRIDSGWSVGSKRRVEVATTPNGLEKAVDYRFDSGTVHGPVREAAKATGWKIGLSPKARAGLLGACIGVGIAVAVGIALIVLAVTGAF